MAKTNSGKELKTAVTQLFETETQRDCIEAALNELNPDKWYRTGEITDKTDSSKNSVRRALGGRPTERTGPLIRFGVFEPKHQVTSEPNIPLYGVAASSVMTLLREWDGFSLTELFEYPTTRKLTNFFLIKPSSTDWTKNAIRHNSTMGFDAVDEHINTVMKSGLLNTRAGTRTTEYLIDTDSEIYQFLADLNSSIMTRAGQYEYTTPTQQRQKRS